MSAPNPSHDVPSTATPSTTSLPGPAQNPSDRPVGAHNGGGLRQAVQELMASVACLCGDAGSNDTAGAKRHLAQAQRLLSVPSRESLRRATPAPVVPAARDDAGDREIQQDLHRAMR